MAKSLGWKRFDHYSIAVADAKKASAFHQKLFGATLNHTFDTPEEGFGGELLDMPGRQAQIELVEPSGDDSFLHDFLAQRGAGLHHVTIEVEDIEQAVEYLRDEMGIEPFRGITSDGNWRETFIHPRDSGGVLYQLIEYVERPADLPE